MDTSHLIDYLQQNIDTFDEVVDLGGGTKVSNSRTFLKTHLETVSIHPQHPISGKSICYGYSVSLMRWPKNIPLTEKIRLIRTYFDTDRELNSSKPSGAGMLSCYVQ